METPTGRAWYWVAERDGVDEVLLADVSGTAIVSTFTNGTLTLTGPAAIADFEQVLRSIEYNNSSQNPTEVDRTLTFMINDGTDDSRQSNFGRFGIGSLTHDLA